MWFLPILLVGAIAMAVVSRSSRKTAPPSRQLPPPVVPPSSPPAPTAPTSVPGPISVLGEILRVGQTPPPTVILCAIAEAQAIGRNDLASDIVQVFVAPVVYHHQRMREGGRGRGTRSSSYERGSCAIDCSPRRSVEAAYTAQPPPPPPMSWSVPPPVAPRADAPAPAAPTASDIAASLAQSPPPSPMPSHAEMTSMDDEINALLHSDPARFMELVSRSGRFPSAAPSAQPSAVDSSLEAAARAGVAQPTDLPPATSAPMQEPPVRPEATARARAMAPGSPIPGVPDDAWRAFVVLLSRESPEFSSSRHVGQFRQRRERLAELGIKPEAIANSAEAQRAALDADLADAHRHGVASEMFAQHLGRPIALPGVEGTKTITLSGVLGVIQCAGLEGAAGWLERASDRKRYPHTTQAFLQTNGVF